MEERRQGFFVVVVVRLQHFLNFCFSKDRVKRVKDKPQTGRRTFVNHISDKHLVFKIYKELSKEHNNKKRNNQIFENGQKI